VIGFKRKFKCLKCGKVFVATQKGSCLNTYCKKPGCESLAYLIGRNRSEKTMIAAAIDGYAERDKIKT
jgi:predicted  nucleic acid-binding Zn-ribbon protein